MEDATPTIRLLLLLLTAMGFSGVVILPRVDFDLFKVALRLLALLTSLALF